MTNDFVLRIENLDELKKVLDQFDANQKSIRRAIKAESDLLDIKTRKLDSSLQRSQTRAKGKQELNQSGEAFRSKELKAEQLHEQKLARIQANADSAEERRNQKHLLTLERQREAYQSKQQKSKESSSDSRFTLGNAIKGVALYEVASYVTELPQKVAEAQSAVESFKLSIKSLIGEEQGLRLVADAIKLIKNSPFEFEDTQESIQGLVATMKAVGTSSADIASQTIPILKSLGNSAAALGGGDRLGRMIYAFNQVRAAGRLMGTEVRQINETGFPLLAALSDTLKIKVSEVGDRISDGAVSFEDFEKAILKAGNAGGIFQNGMANLTSTIKGFQSQLKDTLFVGLANLGNVLAPTIKQIYGATTAIIEFFTGTQERANNTVRVIRTLAQGFAIFFTAFKILPAITAQWAIFSNATRLATYNTLQMAGASSVLTTRLTGIGVSSGTATAGVSTLGASVRALVKSTVILTALYFAFEAVTNIIERNAKDKARLNAVDETFIKNQNEAVKALNSTKVSLEAEYSILLEKNEALKEGSLTQKEYNKAENTFLANNPLILEGMKGKSNGFDAISLSVDRYSAYLLEAIELEIQLAKAQANKDKILEAELKIEEYKKNKKSTFSSLLDDLRLNPNNPVASIGADMLGFFENESHNTEANINKFRKQARKAREAFTTSVEDLQKTKDDLKRKYPEYNPTPSNGKKKTNAEKNAELRALSKAEEIKKKELEVFADAEKKKLDIQFEYETLSNKTREDGIKYRQDILEQDYRKREATIQKEFDLMAIGSKNEAEFEKKKNVKLIELRKERNRELALLAIDPIGDTQVINLKKNVYLDEFQEEDFKKLESNNDRLKFLKDIQEKEAKQEIAHQKTMDKIAKETAIIRRDLMLDYAMEEELDLAKTEASKLAIEKKYLEERARIAKADLLIRKVQLSIEGRRTKDPERKREILEEQAEINKILLENELELSNKLSDNQRETDKERIERYKENAKSIVALIGNQFDQVVDILDSIEGESAKRTSKNLRNLKANITEFTQSLKGISGIASKGFKEGKKTRKGGASLSDSVTKGVGAAIGDDPIGFLSSVVKVTDAGINLIGDIVSQIKTNKYNKLLKQLEDKYKNLDSDYEALQKKIDKDADALKNAEVNKNALEVKAVKDAEAQKLEALISNKRKAQEVLLKYQEDEKAILARYNDSLNSTDEARRQEAKEKVDAELAELATKRNEELSALARDGKAKTNIEKLTQTELDKIKADSEANLFNLETQRLEKKKEAERIYNEQKYTYELQQFELNKKMQLIQLRIDLNKMRAKLAILGILGLGNVPGILAIQDAIKDVEALTPPPKPTFFKGIKDTGMGGNLDKNGGFEAILHKQERVVDAKNNLSMKKANGGVMPENKEVAKYFEIGKMKSLNHNYNVTSTIDTQYKANNNLVKEMKKTRLAIENKSTFSLNVDKHGKYLFEKKNGNKSVTYLRYS